MRRFLRWLIDLLRRLFSGRDKRRAPGPALNVNVEIDMRNALVTWDLPTTRESGLPLDVADIASVEVELSGDGGANFASLDSVVPPAASLEQTELEPGDYIFRLTVVDMVGSGGQPVDAPFNIPDDTPPGSVTNVNVTVSAPE